ncbi:HAD-IIB family hydrolase [Saccharopolyspora elongata]|uniref:HAD-IIB family hydrolase n=1 Tax=Saccharopolyspora elongata TaxID=2530387 RepID=UPI0014043531|nr:HAD-IIB family hydrolase [Saccharopolyspora elongata]
MKAGSARVPVPIDLVATDLDGTLLTGDGELGDRVRAAVRRAQQHGVHVAFITGRPFRETISMLARAGLRGFTAASNGALISDERGEIRYEQVLTTTSAAWAVERLRAGIGSVSIGAVSAEELALDPDFPADLVSDWRDQLGAGSVPDLVRGGRVLKLLVAHPNRSAGELAAATAELLGGGFAVTYSTTRFLEVSHRSADKGVAVELIADALQVELSRVACVGDMPNDLPMLGRGGLAVAVANAADSVLAAADLVIPTNEEHGVATLLDAVVEQRRAARAGARERPPPPQREVDCSDSAGVLDDSEPISRRPTT